MGHSFNHRPERELRQPSGRRMHARHERYPFDIDSEFDEDDFELAPLPVDDFLADSPQPNNSR